MSLLFEKLAEYDVDIKVTMERFLGDEQLYAVCLKEFLGGGECQLLAAALAEKEYEKAFEYAHALKGVTGNLGLAPLYQAVCDLTEPLRRAEYINADALYARVEEEWRRLNALVSDVLE